MLNASASFCHNRKCACACVLRHRDRSRLYHLLGTGISRTSHADFTCVFCIETQHKALTCKHVLDQFKESYYATVGCNIM